MTDTQHSSRGPRNGRVLPDIDNTPIVRKGIAANVRQLATAQDVALAHVADRAGIGRTTLWKLLDASGTKGSDPRLSTIVKLAAVLEVTPADLLEAPAARGCVMSDPCRCALLAAEDGSQLQRVLAEDRCIDCEQVIWALPARTMKR